MEGRGGGVSGALKWQGVSYGFLLDFFNVNVMQKKKMSARQFKSINDSSKCSHSLIDMQSASHTGILEGKCKTSLDVSNRTNRVRARYYGPPGMIVIFVERIRRVSLAVAPQSSSAANNTIKFALFGLAFIYLL